MNKSDAAKKPSPTVSEAGSENCLPIGTRLAEFEITAIIGEGGFGIVYLATDHSLQRTVAIKEYMPSALAARGDDKSISIRSARHQETFATGLKSFINEARLLAQFDHPALIKVHRFWEQNNTAYMAMRYYEGRTLKNVMQRDPATVTEAWLKRMLTPILEALEALYSVQILHRDISPDNIMIQMNGEAVLLDFGAARQSIGDMTQVLTVILKPGYAPIEQYADDASMQQGPWTDIYALSAVIYAAIAHKPPPTSVARMFKDTLEPLDTAGHKGFSHAFLFAINKGLCVKPEDRPQSIAAFRQLLGIETVMPSAQRAARSAARAAASSAAKPAAGQHGKSVESRRLSQDKPEKPAMPGSRIVLAAAIVLAAGLIGGGFMLPNTARTPIVAASPVGLAQSSPSPQQSASVPENINPAPPPITESAVPVPAQAATPVSASAATAVPASVSAPAAIATGTVMLSIKPWGAISVDGASHGVSPPLKKLSLPEGKHRITIANPNFSDYVTEIDVKKKKPGIVQHDFSLEKKTP